MNYSLFVAAALLLGTTTATQAQTTPTGTQHGGVVNQTTVPPINPANPVTNPGTIDQRTPTTNSPTQSGVLGTIDQGTTRPQPTVTPETIRRSASIERPATPRRNASQRKPVTRTITP
ncbi:hypothetical protein [Hymenobacter fodinae]|uniref:Uncharacterized protein n=1 Tax=Hymenobacter fodinae TaxID=2510796 RepID=A0A4Z0P6I0_9BACT|nr:hypothetical protein [Hymenobacter fodinae]TGE07749.1 hypothetical protein EU556_08320 [Hymenobacter fodinae]